MFKQFRTWLANNRNFLFSWYTKDSKETQEPERSLIELPETLQKKVVDAIDNLPSNSADQQAIASILDEAFDRWCADPDNTDNSLVILSSPVAAVSRILSETLKEWTEQKQVQMKPLPLTARPVAIETTKSKLEHYLAGQSQSTDNHSEDNNSEDNNSEDNDSKTQQQEVVVIPNLSWCFLRSLEGLEGIEYLQSLLCNNSQNRFWIIGAGQVAWEYLNSVCNIEVYCGEVFTLPEVEPEKLQQWLEPIVNELDIIFDDPRLDKQLLDGDKDNKTNYFECLADISQGISIVAVQGFLKSICYEEAEDIDDEEKEGIEPKPKHLVAQTPNLPDLPALESADQYILYSLLLHGDLTTSTLAESLGDLESEVHARIQVLRRQGVVEQRGKVLKINSIYYPKLKQKLASNNFIINRE